MSAMNQKRFKYVPPDKGSFPLDHEGLCKKLMKEYMDCLSENNQNTSPCRDQIRAYLDCRMNNELMAKESWSKLGFTEETNKSNCKDCERLKQI